MLHQPFPANFASAIGRMNDRDKLLLIDWISDQLSDDLGEELADGLAVAFERAEEGYAGIFTPIYPAGNVSLAAWSNYRAERDALLARRGAL